MSSIRTHVVSALALVLVACGSTNEETAPGFEAKRSRRERLLALLESAAKFYERYLWESEAGAHVRAYLDISMGADIDASSEFTVD